MSKDTRQVMIEMMRRCEREINSMRAEIESLRPKAEAYDMLKQVLGMMPMPSRGYGEDLAYTLRQEREKLEKELRDERETAKPDVVNGD